MKTPARIAIAIILSLAASAFADTTINPANRYAWGANIGFTDWRPSPADGVNIGDNFCAGSIYAANVGWIKMGTGTPANGSSYANSSASDFGVNCSAGAAGEKSLRGFAYSANIGWINFENTGNPRVVLATGRLRGSIWSANCGWINLDDANVFVQTAPQPSPTPTPTPAATPTATVTPPPTATPSATATPIPTASPIPTATPIPTTTPIPTATPNPTATPIPTATPSPTATPIPTASPSPSPTPTATPLPTTTPTPSATPTATPVATPTPTATPVATPTPTATPVATPTPTPIASATPTPAPTPSATATPTPSATPTPTPTPNSHLANISTRMRVEAGDNVLIAGFIIQGTEDKRIIIRGIGPSLALFDITNPLQDPTLELHANGRGLIATNDNWADNSNAGEIIISNLAPANVAESALLVSVAPGSYTAVLRGKASSTGIGVIEVYDLDADSLAGVANISTRGYVLTGENVMIGGLIVTGDDPSQLVLRGIGPALADFGVPEVLADPLLELHNGDGALLQANNDWDAQDLALQATGLAPASPLESAILISVPPGSYTAILKGADGGIGNGLIEIYKIAP